MANSFKKPKPSFPNPWQPKEVPAKYRFASNDPIYKKAQQLFKLYPWLRALYKLSELMDLIRSYDMATYLTATDTNGFKRDSAACIWGDPPTHRFTYSGLRDSVWDFYSGICLYTGEGNAGNAMDVPIPATETGMVRFSGVYTAYRPHIVDHWYRPVGTYPEKPFSEAPQIKPIVEAAPHPLGVPEIYPHIAAKPLRVPYKLLPLIRSPFIERSYHVDKNQNNQSRNSTRDIASIESVITTNSQGVPVVSIRPATHRPSPPREGTVEVKAKTGGAAKALAFGSAISETADFINALWEALPAAYRDNGYSGMQGKLSDLYNHSSHIDIAKAITNLAKNQIEDYAYGYLPSKVLESINQDIYRGDKYVSRGIMTGHSRRQSYLY